MAIYYLGMKTFGRGRGKSGSRATSGAAYRSGERIRDERTGRVYDHRRRADVLHKEIVLPAQLAARRGALDWARDRSRLWNAAEHAESRRNARVAREFTVALPHELSADARTRLARDFAQHIADRYRSAVDVAVHAPRGDARNFHAHLLSTTREVTPDGLGRKTTLELSGTARHRLGLPRWREEVGALRERWAGLANQALEQAQVATRISPLTRAERGLEPARPPRIPLAAYHIERRGEHSHIAERIRERYRAGPERNSREPGASAAEQEHASGGAVRARLRQLGAGVKASWHALHEKLGARFGWERFSNPADRHALAPGRGLEKEIDARSRPEAAHQPQPLAAHRSRQIAADRPQPDTAHGVSHDLEELRRESARRWLAYREEMESRGTSAAQEKEQEPHRENSRRHDHDYGFGL